jgi:hypothetical protein
MHNPPEADEATKARKIIDHAQLHQITEKLFSRLPIHVVENNQKNPAQGFALRSPAP